MVVDGKPIKKLFERYGLMREFLYEGKRVGPLLGIALILLCTDFADLKVAIFSIGVVLLAASIAQVVRRIIVPYLNIEELVEKVYEYPLACAIVIAATFWFYIQILQTIAIMFK